jgi:hypothetical protein
MKFFTKGRGLLALLCFFTITKMHAQLTCAGSYLIVSTSAASCDASPTGTCTGSGTATDFRARIRVYFTVAIGIGTVSPTITAISNGGVSIFGTYRFCISGDKTGSVERSYIDYCVYGNPGSAAFPTGSLDFTFTSGATTILCTIDNNIPAPASFICLSDLTNCAACNTYTNLKGKIRVFYPSPIPAGIANPTVTAVANGVVSLPELQLCAASNAATNIERSYIDYCVFADLPGTLMPTFTLLVLDLAVGVLPSIHASTTPVTIVCPNAYATINNSAGCSPCDGAFTNLHSTIRLFYPNGISPGVANPEVTSVASAGLALSNFKFCALAGSGTNSQRSYVDYCVYANAIGLSLPGGVLTFTIKTSECAATLDCIVGSTPALYCIDNTNISFSAITTGAGGAGGVAAGCTDQTTCSGAIVYYAGKMTLTLSPCLPSGVAAPTIASFTRSNIDGSVGKMTLTLSPCLPSGVAAPTIASFTRSNIDGSVVRYCVQESATSAAAINTIRCSVSYCVTSTLDNDTYLGSFPTPDLDASYIVTVNASSVTLTQDDCASANIILPVGFGYFTAKRNADKVELKWETITEIDNTGFNLQRKTSGEWSSIIFIKTKADHGNSAGRLNYNYTDANDYAGISQYRLQQVDRDGKFSYSSIRMIRGRSQSIAVFPNPSHNGRISIVTGADGISNTIIIRDVLGKTVRNFTGIQSGTLRVENLSAGYYTIQLTDNSSLQSVFAKFIVAAN